MMIVMLPRVKSQEESRKAQKARGQAAVKNTDVWCTNINIAAGTTTAAVSVATAGSLENGAFPRLARPKQEDLEVISLGLLRLSCHVAIPSHPIPSSPIPYRIFRIAFHLRVAFNSAFQSAEKDDANHGTDDGRQAGRHGTTEDETCASNNK